METMQTSCLAQTPSSSARRKFGRFKKDKPNVLRSISTVARETAATEQLKRLWRRHPLQSINQLLLGTSYVDEVAASVASQNYSAKDVEHFSLLLFEFQDEKNFSEKAGVFLTALIENGKEDDFVIHTSTLAVPIQGLAKGNTKNVLIKGDIGSHTAKNMKKGKVIIKGDEEGYAGLKMTGGDIVILGDAGEVIGWEMKNGSITVHGNAGWNVGTEMKGGEILVYGNVGIFTGRSMQGGRIMVKGNAGDFTGEDMHGGLIDIAGNSTCVIGRGMTGGEIHVGGEYHILEFMVEGGRIYHQGELVLEK